MAEANMTPEQVGADLKTRLEDELRKYETEVLMLEARMRETPSAAETLQGRLDVAKDNMIRVKRALAKPSTMADGGMASGKKHMYLSAGAAVVDNLPNKGTRALAKTTKGRQALKNMGLLK